jgi:hypothetical protein
MLRRSRAPAAPARAPAPEALQDAQTGASLDVLPNALLQRVKIGAGFQETLLQGGGGSYTPTTYTIPSTSTYELKRSDSAVTASVKIFFRDPAGGAIPAADARRAWATDICTKLVAHWNGKFSMTNMPKKGAPAKKKGLFSRAPASLPINFSATAVFDPKADKNAVVDLHGRAAAPTTGDTVRPGGHPIDAGNWYTSSGTSYGTTPLDAIYAHEYGHLLGIPDEYSISNADMHKALHGLDADPKGQKEKDAALDKAGARQIVLDALQPKLLAEIQKIAGAVGEVMAESKRDLRRLLSEGLKKTFQSGSVHTKLKSIVEPQLAAQPRAKKALGEAVRFEASSNMSYYLIAGKIVDQQFSEASMKTLLQAAFTNAINAAIKKGSKVDIGYLSGGAKKTMTVSIGTTGVAGTDAALDTAATNAAAATTGAAAAPGPTGKRPPTVYPSNTLIGQLTGLPAGWKGVANLLDTQVAAMEANVAALGTPALTTPPFDAKNSVRALYKELLARFTPLSEGVAATAMQAFVTDQVNPHLKGQIDNLVAMVEAEADKHHGVAASGGTTGAPGTPPDPAVMAAAKKLHERAQVMQQKSATAATDTPNIKYTVHSMMGSTHAGTDIRTDNLAGMEAQFNSKLRKWGEDDFRVEGK